MLDSKPLEQWCELIVDCPHSTPEWTENGVLVLRNGYFGSGRLDLSNPSFTSEEHYRSRTSRAEPQRGDLVITREAPMGEVARVPEGLRCCLGQRQVLIRPKADASYLFYALQSPYVRRQIGGHDGTGSIVSNLCIPDLKALRIPLLENRSNIVKTLEVIDRKIGIKLDTTSALEEIGRLVFGYWFLQYGFPELDDYSDVIAAVSAQTGAYRSNSGSMTYDEFLKASIPQGWEGAPLSDLITLHYGKAITKASRVPGPYPVIGSGGVYGTHTEPLVEGPGIVVGRKGSVGTVHWSDKAFYPSDTTYYVECKGGVSMSFVYFLLKSLPLGTMNSDSSVPGLDRSALYRLPIVKPDPKTLEAFETIAGQVRKLIASNAAEINALDEVRNWLLPMLMNGQVKVR